MTRAADLAKLIAGSSTLGGTGELVLKDVDTADGSSPKITFQTGDTDIAQDDVLGTIDFQAPDEGTGTDAILVSAGVEAKAEGDFSSSSNATSLVFKTGSSEAAAEKVRIASDGNVLLGTTVAGRADEGADRLTIADSAHSGMTIRSGTGSYGSINFSDSEGGAGEYAGQIWYGHGGLGDKLVLATQGSNRVVVTADVSIEDGNLKVASGHGIDFSATSDAGGMSSELLNDYEEGTYDVTMTCGTSGSITVRSDYNTGGYIKVGNLVTVYGYVVVSGISSPVGHIQVNLPFAVANTSEGHASGAIYAHVSSLSGKNTNELGASIAFNGQSYFRIYSTDGTGRGTASANAVTSSSSMYFGGSYRTG